MSHTVINMIFTARNPGLLRQLADLNFLANNLVYVRRDQ
jgi:hypothetical protein